MNVKSRLFREPAFYVPTVDLTVQIFGLFSLSTSGSGKHRSDP